MELSTEVGECSKWCGGGNLCTDMLAFPIVGLGGFVIVFALCICLVYFPEAGFHGFGLSVVYNDGSGFPYHNS